ncbi:hypothetical protein VNI00_008986 [Paramarasmius palmivorus]|uniref:Uncharacterized protein n=1 Tax=Paramarasmius palmivorus TaxID=297713 RepID=A0AAW0CPC9_9AGAR
MSYVSRYLFDEINIPGNNIDTDTRDRAINQAVQAVQRATQLQQALVTAANRRDFATTRRANADQEVVQAETEIGDCLNSLEETLEQIRGTIGQAKKILSAPSTPKTPRTRKGVGTQTSVHALTPTPSQHSDLRSASVVSQGDADAHSVPGTPRQRSRPAPFSPMELRHLTELVQPSHGPTPPNSPTKPSGPSAFVMRLPTASATIRLIKPTDSIEVLQIPPPFDAGDLEALAITEEQFLRPEMSPDGFTTRYIVYYGVNRSYGYFDRWPTLERQGDRDILGASILCDNRKGTVKRSFHDGVWARKCYVECLQYNIFHMLGQDIGTRVFYIVVKGVEPGVYTSRMGLVKDGLNWHAGVVYRLLGDRADAERLFRLFDAAGHVVKWAPKPE